MVALQRCNKKLLGRSCCPAAILSPGVVLLQLLLLVALVRLGEAARPGPLLPKSSLLLHFKRELLQALGSEQWSAGSASFLSFHRPNSLEEEEDEQGVDEEDHEERHPGDKLLERHKADGTKSYILGGY